MFSQIIIALKQCLEIICYLNLVHNTYCFCLFFAGLMPYNFVCIHTGCVLSQIDSLDDVFTTGTLLKLLGIATVALVPGLLLKKYHMEQQKKKL